MAFTINPEAQLVFFKAVFGANHPTSKLALELQETGVTFELTMYTLKASYKGKPYAVSLTRGTTSLMKHSCEAPVLLQNQNLISDFIGSLAVKIIPGKVQTAESTQAPTAPAVPVAPVVTVNLVGLDPSKSMEVMKGVMKVAPHLMLAQAKAIVEMVQAGETVAIGAYVSKAYADQVSDALVATGAVVNQTMGNTLGGLDASLPLVPAATPPPTPLPQVIDLKQSKALGQKVHGTSKGSVYYTIAIHEHVKVAARLYKTGAISIRAEWQNATKDELQKLAEAGVHIKEGYGSIHFDAGEVPLSRVVGAFLVGTGLPWQQAVMNGADLIIAEKA